MNTTKLNKTLKGFGLAFAMAFGLIAFAGIDANAQGRQDDRYRGQSEQDGPYGQDRRYDGQDDDRYNGRDRNGNQSYRFAFNKGYKDGLKQGMRDARNRQRGNNGAYGNYDGYGNNGAYDNNDGYGNNGRITPGIFGNGNNGNNGNNRQAYQRGYRQGYREGLNRGRNNRRNNNGRY